ncbi:MAG: ornithine cyclodeaminase family protein [Anaerolineae bacterium]|nr:ornithine cyclodeaminase family protein [Anaerolineae bacterium]
MELRILSEDDVYRALPMRRAIEVMKRAFGQLSAGQSVVPLRTRLQTDAGLILLMPAFLQQSRELGFKMVSIWGDNPSKGLPAILALVMVIDPDTGQPRAIINGEALTGLRTGAGGGLAADLLARQEARVVAVFGSGVQARAQLAAVREVRPIEEVRLVGRTAASVEAFAAEISASANPPKVTIPANRQAAVAGADIILAATTSETPVFDGNDVSPGTHITGVGSYAPHMQEVDATTVKRCDKIVVDSRHACLAEAGDLIIPIEEGVIENTAIHGELGQIVNGDLSGREHDGEITFFKSVGVAVQDAAAAAEILKIAEAENLGTMAKL